MATRRKQIIDGLVVELGQTLDVESSNVYKHFKFMDELNDFPAICLIPGTEMREQLGANRILGTLDVSLRGYVFAENKFHTTEI